MTHLKTTIALPLIAAGLLFVSGCKFSRVSLYGPGYYTPRVAVTTGYDYGYDYNSGYGYNGYRPTVYRSGYTRPVVVVSHSKPYRHKPAPIIHHKPSYHKSSTHRTPPVVVRSGSSSHRRPSPVIVRPSTHRTSTPPRTSTPTRGAPTRSYTPRSSTPTRSAPTRSSDGSRRR